LGCHRIMWMSEMRVNSLGKDEVMYKGQQYHPQRTKSEQAHQGKWCTLTLLLLTCLTGLVGAQSQSSAPTFSLLNQMTTASGWTRLKTPADVLATGTLTQYDSTTPTDTDFVIKQKGSSLSRIEIQGGELVTLTNADQAAYVHRYGAQVLPFFAAISMRAFHFPFYSDVTALTDSKITFAYPGTEMLAGQLAHRIEIDREPAANDAQAAARRRVGHLTVWISDTSHLPLQVKFSRVSPDDPTAVVEHTLAFSDYRPVGGVAIPYHLEEYVGSDRISAIQLNDVQTNVGLSDANFLFLGVQK
jgi:hypothetical protein